MLNINKISFDSCYKSEEYGTTTLYFQATKDILDGKYPEACHAEISIELPSIDLDVMCVKNANVMFSPTKYDSEEDSYHDYDWYDACISYEDIEKLIKLAKESASKVIFNSDKIIITRLGAEVVLSDEEAEKIYFHVRRQHRITDSHLQFCDFVGVNNTEALKDKSLEEVKDFKEKYGVYPEEVCDKTSKYYLLEVFADNFLDNYDCNNDENSQFQEVIRDALEVTFLE